MEWNNPFSTINSAFAKISLFAWWPFTIPQWSLRELNVRKFLCRHNFYGFIELVCEKKEGFRFLSFFLAIDTMFYKQRRCFQLELNSLSNFWVLIWSFELLKVLMGVKMISLQFLCICINFDYQKNSKHIFRDWFLS